MQLNPDLDRAKQRWCDWFDGTLTGGPIVAVQAPLPTPRQKPLPVRPPASLREQWCDPEARAARARNQMMATWFGGDFVPTWFTNFGPGAAAAFLGGPYELQDATVWFGELADNSLANIERSLRFDPDNEYWRTVCATTRRALELADGDFLVSGTDLGGAMDILVSLRGNEPLMTDLYDQPTAVHRIEEKILDLWLAYFEANRRILAAAQGDELTMWMPSAYCRRPWYPLQCDFSVMISPDMFAEFVVPRLRRAAGAVGRAIYHWDGPGQLAHVHHLAAIDGIAAFQYVSLPGSPPRCSVHYLPWYQVVIDAGKGLHVHVGRRERDAALELLGRLPPERLAFVCDARDPDDGRELLAAFRAAAR